MEYFDNYESVEIAGFRGKIENIEETLEAIDEIKSNCCDGCIIQLMDAKAIAGKKHIEHGIIHAINGFKRDSNIANDLGIEICLRISAQRQIINALKILGLKKGNMEICAVLINCPDYFLDELNRIFIRDDSVLKAEESILKNIYNISQEELNFMEITDILIDKTSRLIVEL